MCAEWCQLFGEWFISKVCSPVCDVEPPGVHTASPRSYAFHVLLQDCGLQSTFPSPRDVAVYDELSTCFVSFSYAW